MDHTDNEAPGLLKLARRLFGTFVGALENRTELLTLEWQEERARLTESLVWAMALVFLTGMGVVLLTGVIILLCPHDTRVYVTAGFALLYFLGAFCAWFALKRLLRQEPFSDTVDQVKKDRVWLDSLK